MASLLLQTTCDILQDLVPHSLLPPQTLLSDQSFLSHCLLPLHTPLGAHCTEQSPLRASGQAASGQAASCAQAPLASFADGVGLCDWCTLTLTASLFMHQVWSR